MEGLYDWIRNMTGFLIFLSVLEHLIPGKKYLRYIRFFAGMVLILIVLQPLTGSLRVENRIASYYKSFVFQYQADDLKKEILGVEQARLEKLIRQYEEAVEQDVEMMAEDLGLTVRECSAEIGQNPERADFGTVTRIQVVAEAETDELAGRLRRRIISYYELEEAYVEIQIVERKG